MSYESQPSTVRLVTECYAYNSGTNIGLAIDTTAPCIIPGTATAGMTNKVFYVESGGQVQAKLVLNADKNTIAIFSPVDEGGVPYSAPSSCTQGSTCGDSRNYSSVGLGVKVTN
jgi:hypothetical protein